MIMRQISLKISDHLYQELELKTQSLEMNFSDVLRDVLKIGLQHFGIKNSLESTSKVLENSSQKQAIGYTIFSYCLLEEFIKSYAESGSELCDKAHAKAEKLLA